VKNKTPGILSGNEHNHFIIEWLGKHITVKYKEKELLNFWDQKPIAITHIGFKASEEEKRLGKWRVTSTLPRRDD